MKSYTEILAPQRSEAWFAARLGRVTSSSVADVFTKGRGSSESKSRISLRGRLVGERETGVYFDKTFASIDRDRGVELEPEGFSRYEDEHGVLVRVSGFLSHNEVLAGASPDGVVGDIEGVVELKCPRPENHLKYLKGLPNEHRAQVLQHMWISGAEWADFVSYCPMFPQERHRLIVHRTMRDPAAIAEHEAKVRAFLATCDLEWAALQGVRILEFAKHGQTEGSRRAGSPVAEEGRQGAVHDRGVERNSGGVLPDHERRGGYEDPDLARAQE